MSVLVKGMKMPEGCITCVFKSDGMYDRTMWCQWLDDPLGDYGKCDVKWRHPACPLVEVPTPQHRPATWGDVYDSLKVLEALLEAIEAEEGDPNVNTN